MTELQRLAFEHPWMDDTQERRPPARMVRPGVYVGLSLNK